MLDSELNMFAKFIGVRPAVQTAALVNPTALYTGAGGLTARSGCQGGLQTGVQGASPAGGGLGIPSTVRVKKSRVGRIDDTHSTLPTAFLSLGSCHSSL